MEGSAGGSGQAGDFGIGKASPDALLSQEYKSCMGIAENSKEKKECATDELNAQESRVSDAYDVAVKKVEKPGVFEKEHEAWFKAIQKYCVPRDNAMECLAAEAAARAAKYEAIKG